jgi:hypothetical protein
MIGRLRAASLVLAALAAGLLLVACGSSGNAELLPGTTADQINSNLDQVRVSVEEGDCEAAEDGVAEVSTEVDGLEKVDKKLKEALKQGAAKLSEVVSRCGAEEEAEAEEQAEEEAEAQEAFEAEEAEAEEEGLEKEQKAEEREEKAQEKAEKQAEQPSPPGEGEESGSPNGKAKGHEQEETVEPPSEEEVIPPTEGGGAAGGIGPGGPAEGGD